MSQMNTQCKSKEIFEERDNPIKQGNLCIPVIQTHVVN